MRHLAEIFGKERKKWGHRPSGLVIGVQSLPSHENIKFQKRLEQPSRSGKVVKMSTFKKKTFGRDKKVFSPYFNL